MHFIESGNLRMKMYIKSVIVDDQEKALAFYKDTLGFTVKHDIPMGEYRWLTLVSAEEPDGVELALEPDAHPASKSFQSAIKNDGIPYTAFSVEDIDAEYKRLCKLGVKFSKAPVKAGGATMAIFDDTCGNLIQILQLD